MLEPFDLILVPTRNCNLRCRYCPVDKREEGLDAETSAAAVTAFVSGGGRSVRLTGGEPLLAWPVVERIVEETAGLIDKGMDAKLEICTNGTLLDREKLASLDRPWITIVLSLDGGLETHTANRFGRAAPGGRETFLRLLDIAAVLVRRGGYVVTQTIAPRKEASLFDDFLFLWNLGIRNFNFLPVYYRTWKEAQLRDLEKGLGLIARYLGPHVSSGRARVRNAEKKGVIPLFGHALCLDSDGGLYYTNAVLLGRMRASRRALKIADGFSAASGLPESLPDRSLIASSVRRSFPAWVLRSNAKVDRRLSAFVSMLKELPEKPASPFRPGAAKPGKRKRPERLELHLSYRCTNDCVFCSEHDRIGEFHARPVTAAEAFGALITHRRAGGSHVNLTGGEPTLHPLFIPLLSGAKTLGLRTYVGTNGVMLAGEQFARAALPFIDELSLSVHGPDEKIHDAATGRTGSHRDITAAAGHAVRINPAVELMANMVVTKLNFKHVPAVISLCARLGARQVLVSNPSPEGRALERYAEIAVRLADWRGALDEIVAAGDGKDVIIRFFGIPLCVLGDWKQKSNDLFFDPRVTVERANRAGGRTGMSTIVTRRPRRGRRYVVACGRCAYKDLCGGVFTHYVRLFKDSEIEPIA
ncbi:MAG: radical SAM protein [Pseudomonadota bacterium]